MNLKNRPNEGEVVQLMMEDGSVRPHQYRDKEPWPFGAAHWRRPFNFTVEKWHQIPFEDRNFDKPKPKKKPDGSGPPALFE